MIRLTLKIRHIIESHKKNVSDTIEKLMEVGALDEKDHLRRMSETIWNTNL